VKVLFARDLPQTNHLADATLTLTPVDCQIMFPPAFRSLMPFVSRILQQE
jgi:hypothetical protein